MARRESSGNRTRYPGVKNLGGGEFLIRAIRRDPASGMRRQKERTVRASSVADAFDQRRALEKELNGEVSPMSLSAREETRVPDRDLRLVVGSSKRPSANGAGTLGELAKDWLKRRLAEQRKDGRARLVTSTRGRYVCCVEQVIVPMLGEWRIDQLDHQGIERWRDHLAKRYASASVNGHLRVLRAILRDAGTDVASRVRSLEEDDTRITEDSPNLLETEQDVTRFLDLFRESFPQHYPLVGLLVTTGMRIGTALALQRSDFEAERGIVVARRRLSRNEVIEGVKRGRTARDTLPLVDWVWAAIEAEWKDHNKAQRESGLAFPTSAGGYRARSCLMKPFAEAKATLGLSRITPHGLRRTAATMYRRAASSAVSMSVLGHLTEQMHRHYSVVSPNEKRAAAELAFAKVGSAQKCGPECGPGADRSALGVKKRREA